MKCHHSSTAIVLFARQAENEAIHKSLLGSHKSNIRLHEELILATKEVARKSRGTFLHFHEGLQEGQTFGDRLANCAQSVFEQGFERIILIGGDCPDLSTSDINEAIEALDQDKFALGADHRGGAYLIGFTKNHFEFSSFQKLKWNTQDLFGDIKRYASSQSEVAELNEKVDLNVLEDVLSNARSSRVLGIILFKLFSSKVKALLTRTESITLIPIFSLARRGPPALG